MKSKNFILIFFLYFFSLTNVYSIEPDIFIQSTVNRASKILSDDISKEQKIEELKKIAKDTVDIRGIGFYTLGAKRKSLSENQKEEYINIFEEYFLKTFSSRLAEYTNPEIDVFDKEILNKNYTLVNSLLKGTAERPEVKIIITIKIQIVRLVNNCFNLELDFKKAGRTNKRTPIIYIAGINLSINSLNYFTGFGGPARTRTWDQYIMSVLL